MKTMLSTRSLTKDQKALLNLIWPLVISFWMRAAFTFVDTIFAATLGDHAVAAIGLTVPFEFLMIALWAGLSAGLTATFAKAVGIRDWESYEKYKRLGLRIIYVVSPIFVLVGLGIWVFADQMNLEQKVTESFRIYGAVLLAGSGITAFWSILPDSLIKAFQDAKTTMWSGILSNITNVTLNTIFLFVFEWGIFGIAFSTVLGRLAGLVYALIKAREHLDREKSVKTASKIPTPDPKPLQSILNLAIPASITYGLMSAETAFVNMFLAKDLHPTEAIAAYSIYFRFILFFLNPIIATSVALLPYVANRYSQGNYQGILEGFQLAKILSIVYSILFVAPIMFFGGPLLAQWLAESPQTLLFTKNILFLVGINTLIGAPFFFCRPIFEGMQKGSPGLFASIFRYLILTVPILWISAEIAQLQNWPILYTLVIVLILVAGISSFSFERFTQKHLQNQVANLT